MALLRNSRKERNGTIVKCIALCPISMKPRLVLKAVRTGLPNDICTQQEVNKGDVVIMVTTSIELGTETVDILHVDRVTRDVTFMSKITAATVDMNPNGVGNNWLGLFETSDAVLRDWLTHKDQSMLLPNGYGWTNGQTRYEETKMREFNELLTGIDDSVKSDLVKYAMVSPRANVNHQWATAQPIPTSPITRPPSKMVVSHFTIVWTADGADLTFYDDKDYTKEYLYIDTLKNDAVKKALVGTIIRNKNTNNVFWKLYA